MMIDVAINLFEGFCVIEEGGDVRKERKEGMTEK
jgi:hypothetical protein